MRKCKIYLDLCGTARLTSTLSYKLWASFGFYFFLNVPRFLPKTWWWWGPGRRGGGGGRERLYAPEVVAGFTFNPASYYGASQVTFSEQTVNKHELVVKLTLVLLCQDSISHIQDPSNSYMKAQPPPGNLHSLLSRYRRLGKFSEIPVTFEKYTRFPKA